MPGNGNVAEPGLHVVTPGSGEMRMWPVSVCHHVSTIGQKRSLSGKSGVPSYMTPVAPLASGPYTMYECPVTHPMSAVHQYTSSSRRSKIIRCVALTPVRYPPVVCTMPLGLPVEPEV